MSLSEIRQIIDSPFLMQPVVVRPRDTGARELVDEQILVLLPDAFQLRCDPQSGESPDARITNLKTHPVCQALVSGTIDRRMGTSAQGGCGHSTCDETMEPVPTTWTTSR